MAKPKEIILKEPCSRCGQRDVDTQAMQLRDKLSAAGRLRAASITPRERARNVKKSQRTKKMHKIQQQRHEFLGRPYVKGQIISDEEWNAVWKTGKLADLQHPSA